MAHMVVVHISLWTPNIMCYPEYLTGFVYTCLNTGQIPRRSYTRAIPNSWYVTDLGVSALAQREAPARPKFLVLMKACSRPGRSIRPSMMPLSCAICSHRTNFPQETVLPCNKNTMRKFCRLRVLSGSALKPHHWQTIHAQAMDQILILVQHGHQLECH